MVLAAVVGLLYGRLDSPKDFFGFIAIGITFVLYLGLAVFFFVLSKQNKEVEIKIESTKAAANTEDERIYIRDLLESQKDLSSLLGLRDGLYGLGRHLNELRIARDFTIPAVVVLSFNFPLIQIFLFGILLSLELAYLIWYRPFPGKILNGTAILQAASLILVLAIFGGLYTTGHLLSETMIKQNWTLALLILLGANVLSSITSSLLFLISDTFRLYVQYKAWRKGKKIMQGIRRTH